MYSIDEFCARVYRTKMWSVKCGMYIYIYIYRWIRMKMRASNCCIALRVENRNQLNIHMHTKQNTYTCSLPLVDKYSIKVFFLIFHLRMLYVIVILFWFSSIRFDSARSFLLSLFRSFSSHTLSFSFLHLLNGVKTI